jgi:hypothetical protein
MAWSQVHSKERARSPRSGAREGGSTIDWEATTEIKTLNGALAWGDEWERAYNEERREHLREVKRLLDRIFELEHALKAEEFERALDKAKEA